MGKRSACALERQVCVESRRRAQRGDRVAVEKAGGALRRRSGIGCFAGTCVSRVRKHVHSSHRETMREAEPRDGRSLLNCSSVSRLTSTRCGEHAACRAAASQSPLASSSLNRSMYSTTPSETETDTELEALAASAGASVSASNVSSASAYRNSVKHSSLISTERLQLPRAHRHMPPDAEPPPSKQWREQFAA